MYGILSQGIPMVSLTYGNLLAEMTPGNDTRDNIEWDRTLYCYKPRKMSPNLVRLAF